MHLVSTEKYADETVLPSVSQRLGRVIVGGMLVAGMCIPATALSVAATSVGGVGIEQAYASDDSPLYDAASISEWHEYTDLGSNIKWGLTSSDELVLKPISGTVGRMVGSFVNMPLPESHSSLIVDGTIECYPATDADMNGFSFAPLCSSASFDGSGFDVSHIKNFDSAFAHVSTSNIDISMWNMHNAENLSGMFKSSDVTAVSLPTDLSHVTTMSQMFYDCDELQEIDLSGLNTGSLADTSSMFEGCHHLTLCNLSGLKSLAAIDFNNLSEELYISSENMFGGCFALEQLSLQGWNFYDSNLLSINELPDLTTIDLRGAQFSPVENGTVLSISTMSSLKAIYADPGTDWRNCGISFGSCPVLVGGMGTKLPENVSDLADTMSYAIIDGYQGVPGVLTAKAATEPSVGYQDGSGKTDLNMQSLDVGERGGTSEKPYLDGEGNPTDDESEDHNPYYNPDAEDPKDGLGDNIAFTVPSALNYVVKPDGSLIAPQTGYLENRTSSMDIRASSLKATAMDGWHIVSNAKISQADNAVDLRVGAPGSMVEVVDYVGAKKALPFVTAWSMKPYDGVIGNGADTASLSSDGHVANLTKSIQSRQKFGELRWYVMPDVISPVSVGVHFNVDDAIEDKELNFTEGDMDMKVFESLGFTPKPGQPYYLYVQPNNPELVSKSDSVNELTTWREAFGFSDGKISLDPAGYSVELRTSA